MLWDSVYLVSEHLRPVGGDAVRALERDLGARSPNG